MRTAAIGLVLAAAAVAALFLLRPRLERLRVSLKLTQARKELAAGHPDGARKELIDALVLAPGDGDSRALLAQLELDEKHLDQAYLHFQALSELQPGSIQAWTGLARVRIATGQPEEAEAALSRAIDAGLTDGAAFQERAGLRRRFGRSHGALVDVERAVARGVDRKLLEQPSGSAPPLPRRGAADRADAWPGQLGELMRDFLTKLRARDLDGAKQLAAKARQLWPATFMGPWLDGLIAYQRGDPQAAEKSFREALRSSPRSHRAVTNLIPIWQKQGGALHVGDELSALVDADPGFAYPLQIVARAYLEGDQPARAEAALQRELALLPDSPVPFRDLAAFDLELDRASEAIVVCERGLSRFPQDAELHLDAARSYVLLGDRTQAIQSYDAALRERPDDQTAASELAALLVEGHQQSARALTLVRELERDAPIDPEVLGAMGAVYLEGAGDAVRARQLLEPASAAAPGNSRLHYQLAVALQKTGSAERAVDELRSALAKGRPFRGEAEARSLLRQLAP